MTRIRWIAERVFKAREFSIRVVLDGRIGIATND
jgi:hypothetical protein